jgi:hypothetical protein
MFRVSQKLCSRRWRTSSVETDSYLWQDLEQEAMDKEHRLLLCDPDTWMCKLERLTSLALRSALRRGRSVFRADPGPR